MSNEENDQSGVKVNKVQVALRALECPVQRSVSHTWHSPMRSSAWKPRTGFTEEGRKGERFTEILVNGLPTLSYLD